MFVAQYIPFQLQLNLLDRLPAIVGDMYVNIYACSADPDLSMKACSDPNDFQGGLARFDPLIRCCEWAW